MIHGEQIRFILPGYPPTRARKMSSRRKYPRFSPRLKYGEKSALDKLRKPGETDRELLLRLAGIDASPFEMGPTRIVSHDVLSDSQLTDIHEVKGFDGDLFKKAQDARLKKKREG